MKAAIIGCKGAVGKELQKLCEDWEQNLKLFGSEDILNYDDLEIAFFCVNSKIARREIPRAKDAGVFCIDASTAFREDPNVPLIIPEINGQKINQASGVVSSPNCTTTIMLLPLAPIHWQYKIKRIVVTTFQAVSGAGYRATQELEKQLSGDSSCEVFPVQCAHNIFLHESMRDQFGYCEEERKMQNETRKILEDSEIAVTARCIRVPVFRAHCLSVNVELSKSFNLSFIKGLLEEFPGVIYKNGVTALDATLQKNIYCGNLRKDFTKENSIELWICGDQLLKGAALNLYQLAREICLI